MYNPTEAIERLYNLHQDAKSHRRVIQQSSLMTDKQRTYALAANSAFIKQTRRLLTEAQFSHARQRIEESAERIASSATSALASFTRPEARMDAGGICSWNEAYSVDSDAAGYGSGEGA